MRLADFITANTDAILAEWVAFAESCGSAGTTMDLTALRDHAVAMLEDIVTDLKTPQTASEQKEKSEGKADSLPEAPDTAAEVHGAGRAESGFTVGEMVSEYRALRASVIRLWTRANGTLTGADLDDLNRFNEAIDQSLAESISRFASDVDRSRDMFIAVLGHDLRSPLGAVTMGAQFMLDTGELAEPHLTLTTRIASSAKRMNQMVGDLLDFTRSRLGAGVPIVRKEMDLAKEVSLVVDEVSAANPTRDIQFTAKGDARGAWDSARLGQVFANLLGNAVQYGVANAPITVSVAGETNDAVVKVHNRGTTISKAELGGIFSPFKRLKAGVAATTPTSNLGLGLYIADRIVTAHGGSIAVQSTDAGGTEFTVRLPREAALAH